MKILELEAGQRLEAEELGRSLAASSEIEATAARIIAAVRERGDAALQEYTRQFDGEKASVRLVMDREFEMATARLAKPLTEALKAAGRSINDFHMRQKTQSWFVTRPDGALVGSRVSPLSSVGIYVPGGRASYPTSVLMNALPARVAGVERIVMVTPPQADGSVNPAVLVAARLAGVSEVYTVGGAQAIAALAYGTESISPVDKIVGPGNAYVAAAKRLVAGDVGIDMVAGPSEACILADETADSDLIAIDLLAQAEHDPDARTYLVTTDEELVDEVIERVEFYLARTARLEVSKAAIDNNCLILVCDDLPAAITAVNQIAPEHLEVHMDQPLELLGMIENAGAIFLGPWTPISVGDYLAGPNHTLPTGGTARWASPLSVDDFVKRSSVISYSYAALSNDAPTIKLLADAEGLWAHGRSVEMRFEDEASE
ncbi:MAG: histidinol dehydrogenase [Coriobacteriia bacterium]|nr:histidinol dehydrogenase [Coriobacteriia bacterium]